MYALKQKFLWLSHSYKFRWAHTPLCSRFIDGAFRLGSVDKPFMYICRSCTLVYLGIFFGLICISVSESIQGFLLPTVLFLAVTVLLPSYPSWYKSYNRTFKDVLRLLLGVLIATTLGLTWFVNIYFGIAIAGLIFIAWRFFSLKRIKLKGKACNGCPELPLEKICSGYEFAANNIRSYEDKATYLYISSGRSPM